MKREYITTKEIIEDVLDVINTLDNVFGDWINGTIDDESLKDKLETGLIERIYEANLDMNMLTKKMRNYKENL